MIAIRTDVEGGRPWVPTARPVWALAILPAMADGQADLADGPRAESFEWLRRALDTSGGVARGDDLAPLLADSCQGDDAALARLIISGEVFGFDWQRAYWLPMFQFDLRDLSVRTAARRVRADLDPAMDGWQQAMWFTRPNGWLHDHRPVDLLASALPAVLAAARADRFISAGC